jgi:hypothetical protein
MKKNKLNWLLLGALPFLLITGSCKKFLDREPLQQTLADLNQGILKHKALDYTARLEIHPGFRNWYGSIFTASEMTMPKKAAALLMERNKYHV